MESENESMLKPHQLYIKKRASNFHHFIVDIFYFCFNIIIKRIFWKYEFQLVYQPQPCDFGLAKPDEMETTK